MDQSQVSTNGEPKNSGKSSFRLVGLILLIIFGSLFIIGSYFFVTAHTDCGICSLFVNFVVSMFFPLMVLGIGLMIGNKIAKIIIIVLGFLLILPVMMFLSDLEFWHLRNYVQNDPVPLIKVLIEGQQKEY